MFTYYCSGRTNEMTPWTSTQVLLVLRHYSHKSPLRYLCSWPEDISPVLVDANTWRNKILAEQGGSLINGRWLGRQIAGRNNEPVELKRSAPREVKPRNRIAIKPWEIQSYIIIKNALRKRSIPAYQPLPALDWVMLAEVERRLCNREGTERNPVCA